MPKRGLMIPVVLVLLCGMLTSCGATAVPTKAPEPARVPTPIPVATQIPTPVPQPTQGPTPVPEATQEVAAAALRVTGNVEQEIGWSEAQVKAMSTKKVQSKNQSGDTETYTGVAIIDLLALAKPKSDAATLVFVAGGGSKAEVSLAQVRACADCIVSFRSRGGFSAVLPGFADEVQVKGVIEIQVR
jgi:hypothetical protein